MPPEHHISSHNVYSKLECSLRCLQEPSCLGYNYRSASNNYAVNCQLSNETQERGRGGEKENGSGEWTFYQDLETVSRVDKKLCFMCESRIECRICNTYKVKVTIVLFKCIISVYLVKLLFQKRCCRLLTVSW